MSSDRLNDGQTASLLSVMAQDVRGEVSGGIEPLDLPLTIPLDRASEVLGLDVEAGRRMLEAGTYPVKAMDLGDGCRVNLSALVRAAGLPKVHEVLSPGDGDR